MTGRTRSTADTNGSADDTAPVRDVLIPALLLLAALLALSGCSGGDTQVESSAAESSSTGRSSGQLAYVEPSDEAGAAGASNESGNDGDGDDPASNDGTVSQPTPGSDTGAGSGDADDQDDEGDQGGSFVPVPRPDGIELTFVDGALGPAELGSTIDEIGAALGPLYTITTEESIRVDFPSGYSVAKGGEVLFWAIEEEGVITLFMSSSPKVGLESGLRPKLPIDDAIAIHGEPTFTLGPESREFVSFEDGVGGEGTLSVLAAIGAFGGPVGVYESPSGELGEETVAYQSEEANIKELWFWATSPGGEIESETEDGADGDPEGEAENG